MARAGGAPLSAAGLDLSQLPVHKDERQVELDVQRSFVAWDIDDRPVRRQQLDTLIRSTLRRHPELHYFQGFHDLVAVVLVTLCPSTAAPWPSDACYACVQATVDRLSLAFARDSHAADLLPVMGQLKIVRNIVRAADAPYAYALENAFYPNHMLVALPWLLTLFTHSAPQLYAAQRMLDYVWASGPTSTLYVCAALLLARKAALAARAAKAQRGIETLDSAELHHALAQAPEVLGDDASLSALLTHAAELQRDYTLRCPAVHAHTVLGEESALFTWDPAYLRLDDARRILTLPTARIALDPMPTPHDEAPMPVPMRAPRVTDVLRGMLRLHVRRHRRLLFSTLSLLVSGGVLGLVVALLWAEPRAGAWRFLSQP